MKLPDRNFNHLDPTMRSVTTLSEGTPLPIGHRLGDFEITSVLGHGGFGIAYKATEWNLGRTVAVKEYFPYEFAVRDPDGTAVRPVSQDMAAAYRQGLEVFINEAQTLAKFHHPAIVRILRLIVTANTAYIVMDYERGDTLLDVARTRGHLNAYRVGELMRELLSGLSAIHKKAVTHCDITPRNIILRQDGTAVLIDFGAARTTWDTGVKANVMAAYTPSYAPPEVWSIDGNCGPWSDLYSLGAVMFRCISGQSPPSVEARTAPMEAGAKRPIDIDATLSALGPSWPTPLVECIKWMLRIPSEERPQSADEIFAALNEFTGEFERPKVGKSTRALGQKAPGTASKVTRIRAPTKPKVSQEVQSLFKRRIERLCPTAAPLILKVALTICDDAQLLNCISGLRLEGAEQNSLIRVGKALASQAISQREGEAAIAKSLHVLTQQGAEST